MNLMITESYLKALQYFNNKQAAASDNKWHFIKIENHDTISRHKCYNNE